jgi:hypothetical protein
MSYTFQSYDRFPNSRALNAGKCVKPMISKSSLEAAPTKELSPSMNKLVTQGKITIKNGQYVLSDLFQLIVIHTPFVFLLNNT